MSPETQLWQAHKGHCLGHCHQPCFNSGNASNYLCPSGALFTKATSAIPHSPVPGPHDAVYVGLPRESWRQTRPQPAFMCVLPSFKGQTCPSWGLSLQSLGYPVGAEFKLTDYDGLCLRAQIPPSPGHDPGRQALTSLTHLACGQLPSVLCTGEPPRRWH